MHIVIDIPTVVVSLVLATIAWKLFARDSVASYLDALVACSVERRWRTQKPSRIILVRHGQSLGNVDQQAYAHTSDNCIPLTDKGKEEALQAGKRIKELVGDESVRFIVSPYKRTRETFAEIRKSFDAHQYSVREDPRIREQDFGNFQDTQKIVEEKKKRYRYGQFYYRFTEGESGADVFDRVSTFLESLHRSFGRPGVARNFVLVSHGLVLRIFLMRYFKWSVEDFHSTRNFRNCEIAVLSLNGNKKYDLDIDLMSGTTRDSPHGISL